MLDSMDVVMSVCHLCLPILSCKLALKCRAAFKHSSMSDKPVSVVSLMGVSLGPEVTRLNI